MTAEEVDGFVQANEPNDQLLAYIAKLKPAYKIGILSNVSSDRTLKLFGEKHSLFDAITLSCNIGIAKPDQQAYIIAAKQIGVYKDECVFIDDRPENVIAARQLGMIGIEYTSFVQLREQLTAVLR